MLVVGDGPFNGDRQGQDTRVEYAMWRSGGEELGRVELQYEPRKRRIAAWKTESNSYPLMDGVSE